jgi:hypothetical protein
MAAPAVPSRLGGILLTYQTRSIPHDGICREPATA